MSTIKMTTSCYIAILINLYNDLKLVSSLQHRVNNMSETYVKQHTNT